METNPLYSEYQKRINRALDYIENHIDEPLALADLATAASFSKFHFSRIFQAMIGESPFQFILRVRLERAASLLLNNQKETITDIALKCGFTDLSVFSRNFTARFGRSATDYRRGRIANSNQSKTVSNTKQEPPQTSMYFCSDSQTIKWRTEMKLNKSVEVKEMPVMTLAYVRHIGPYQGNDKLFEGLWNKLFSWAGPRGLIGGPDFRSLVIYHDDPNITSSDKLRMSVCITVPPATKVDGEIGKMELEAATCMIARFEVGPHEFGEAWNWVYGEWLPTSGYQPDDKPCYEMYPEEPKDGKFVVDICVPVKPL